MVHLYITTDSLEAKILIEGIMGKEKLDYKYHKIDFIHGEFLKRKMGFNPMCSIEIDKINIKELNKIAIQLIKEGLYVTTEINKNIKKYFPKDIEIKEEILKLWLQKKNNFLLKYSINPYKIIS